MKEISLDNGSRFELDSTRKDLVEVRLFAENGQIGIQSKVVPLYGVTNIDLLIIKEVMRGMFAKAYYPNYQRVVEEDYSSELVDSLMEYADLK